MRSASTQPSHCRPRRSRAGLSLIEVIVAMAILATLSASLASAIFSNDRMRKSVAATHDALLAQRALTESLLAVPVVDLMNRPWATAGLGLAQAVAETDVDDPALSGHAVDAAALTDAAVVPQTGLPEGFRAWIQYHWAVTTTGHRGLLDTGLDGTDLDLAPDPWADGGAASAGMRDPGVLSSSLVPGGPADIPEGTPFVVRVVMAWRETGGGFVGRPASSAALPPGTLARTATLHLVRTR
jgi:prepilin-type N-terminal cleavage/methylation domain-containing protein